MMTMWCQGCSLSPLTSSHPARLLEQGSRRRNCAAGRIAGSVAAAVGSRSTARQVGWPCSQLPPAAVGPKL